LGKGEKAEDDEHAVVVDPVGELPPVEVELITVSVVVFSGVVTEEVQAGIGRGRGGGKKVNILSSLHIHGGLHGHNVAFVVLIKYASGAVGEEIAVGHLFGFCLIIIIVDGARQAMLPLKNVQLRVRPQPSQIQINTLRSH
jgi:hypothetical protein